MKGQARTRTRSVRFADDNDGTNASSTTTDRQAPATTRNAPPPPPSLHQASNNSGSGCSGNGDEYEDEFFQQFQSECQQVVQLAPKHDATSMSTRSNETKFECFPYCQGGSHI